MHTGRQKQRQAGIWPYPPTARRNQPPKIAIFGDFWRFCDFRDFRENRLPGGNFSPGNPRRFPPSHKRKSREKSRKKRENRAFFAIFAISKNRKSLTARKIFAIFKKSQKSRKKWFFRDFLEQKIAKKSPFFAILSIGRRFLTSKIAKKDQKIPDLFPPNLKKCQKITFLQRRRNSRTRICEKTMWPGWIYALFYTF